MIVKDLLPPTLVTVIKGFLHALIANEPDGHVMTWFAFRCRQCGTDLAHMESQVQSAYIAWMSSQHEVGHGLHANSKKGHAVRYLIQKIKGYTLL